MKSKNKNRKDKKDEWICRLKTTKEEPIVSLIKVGSRLICATKKGIYTIESEE